MYRDQYRASAGDLGYGRGGSRWDAERFTLERDRNRYGGDRFEERDTRITTVAGRGGRPRERSADELFDRRGPPRGDYEEERIRERVYYDEPEEPRFAREPLPIRRPRGQSITIEKEREREYFSPSPPRRAPRPGLLRRQSSLDTFDRRPFREEYGPPARRADYRDPYERVPLPPSRALGPPRRFVEREYDEIKIAEPDFYGDDEYRGYPERVREREIIRTRRRSRSNSSGSSDTETVVSRAEFPKRGKTRMPAKLVNKQAIIELGYPFEEEGHIIIIQKALGRENIDEVIKLSEEYKERMSMSGGRSNAGHIVEERRTEEIIEVPDVPHGHGHTETEVIQKTTTIEKREVSPARTTRSHSPHIIHTGRPEYVERSNEMIIGPLALAGPDPHHHVKDERAIRQEIKALEAEREALRAEKRANRELLKADLIRREGRIGGSEEIILYEERRESDGGVEIKKDKKGPNPRAVRAMLKTLT